MVIGTVEPTEGTPEEEPAEPLEQQVPTETAPPEEPEMIEMEAYKGLQRTHQRTKEDLKDLREELEALKRQPQQPQYQGMGGDPIQQQAYQGAMAVYNQKKAEGVDEAAAQTMFQLAYQAIDSRLRFDTLNVQTEQEKARIRAEQNTEAAMQEMRELARDVGVNPDDPELDYGDRRSGDVASQMRVFRQSLKAVQARMRAQAPAQPQTVPSRSAGRIEHQEPTGTPGKPDAEQKKQAFLALNDALRTGKRRLTPQASADLKRLKDEAIAAGATF